MEMDSKIQGKEDEVRSLKDKLGFQKMEFQKMEQFWETNCHQVTAYWKEKNARMTKAWKEEESSFNKTLFDFNAEWESRWIVRQEEVVAELKTLQADWERKMSQVTLEKDDLISASTENKKVLLDTMVKLSLQETEMNQSEKEWQEKYKALQHSLTLELAVKEASWKKEQELTKNKSFQMEEKIKLLTQQNIELQELAGKTDKEKAKMKKDEMKAKKEFEKRLKKERKEMEEKEKKEKEENERKEKEQLKREKKEKEEREKKDKKERKEREKREKKENKKKREE